MSQRDLIEPQRPFVRTLLISGAKDEYIESLETLRRMIPGSEIQRPPGDHLTTLSQSEFRQAIVEFLTRLAGRRCPPLRCTG